MTLLRAVYRTMLASYFVTSGVKAVRNPAPLAPLAEPIADRVVPLVKKFAPDQVAGYVPEDTQTLVRVNGAVQIIGGLALASGKGRRVGALLLAGSLVPSTLAKYPFWSQSDPDEKAASRSHFAKNVSLLGGVLLASRDTEGKPGLAWRAQKGGHAIAKSANKTGDKLAKKASHLTGSSNDLADTVSKQASKVTDHGSDLAEAALAGGAALVGTVAATSRKARKSAAKQLKETKVVVAKQAKEAQAVAVKQAKEARELAAKRAEEAKVAAAKQAKVAKKEGAKQAKVAQKKAKKLGKHIHLGEN